MMKRFTSHFLIKYIQIFRMKVEKFPKWTEYPTQTLHRFSFPLNEYTVKSTILHHIIMCNCICVLLSPFSFNLLLLCVRKEHNIIYPIIGGGVHTEGIYIGVSCLTSLVFCFFNINLTFSLIV